MASIFSELIKNSRRISRDDFAINFGLIAEDVVEMLTSPEAQRAVQEARDTMEKAGPLKSGEPSLRQLEYGVFSNAPELERGEVAAVDGTTALPIQIFSAGQALCVGVGSISHRRPLQDSLHYWSSKVFLSQAKDTDDFLARQEQGLFGISQTAYLRYYEVMHGLEIDEPFVLFDGPIIYEWLIGAREGTQLYEKLFSSNKRCIGIMKNIKANATFATFARALRQGEVYIIENLFDHLVRSDVSNRNPGESSNRFALNRQEFTKNMAPHILRGVFKPAKKAFGFEVHEDHLEDMLRIMSADCQLNSIGHEIPFLLNIVDQEVRRFFSPQILSDRIAAATSSQSEELFFEETNEREFR